jgi:hypothetical protein
MSAPRVLPDGTLVYPPKGKPPTPPQGYKVGSSKWILVPEWTFCPFRTYQVYKDKDCQCNRADFFCGHPVNNIDDIRPLVSVNLCSACKLWKN